MTFNLDYYDENALYESGLDLIKNGFHVMPLHKFTLNGNCSCTRPNCTAAGKHPNTKDWRNCKPLTEDSIESIFDSNTPHGLGIVLKPDQLIIDVDCANGKKGLESKRKLEKLLGQSLDQICNYSVLSGSGSGSTHYYFKKPPDIPIRKKLTDEYPDIDFLSDGCYVVACESIHKSGKAYYLSDLTENDINKLTDAPKKLLELIEHKQTYIDRLPSDPESCTIDEIMEILSYIPPDIDYDEWYRVIYGVHHDTRGSIEGLNTVDAWSANGAKYEGPESIQQQWKAAENLKENQITINTVKYIASQHGYKQLGEEVEGTIDDFFKKVDNNEIEKQVIQHEGQQLQMDDIPEVLRNPPGILKSMVNHAMSISNKPSFLISLVGALQAIGVLAGRDFRTSTNNYTNNYFFVIGDTGCGKEMLKDLPSEIVYAVANAFQIESERRCIATGVTSPGALFSALETHPRMLLLWDEFAHFLEASKGKESDKKLVVSKLLELFSEVKREYLRPEYSKQGVRKEDREEDTPRVLRPLTCFTAITTPIQMQGVLSKKFMEDGTINRFVVVLPQEQHEIVQLQEPKPVPVDILSWFDKVLIALCRKNNAASFSSLDRSKSDEYIQQVILPWNKKALDKAQQYQYDIAELRKTCRKKGYYYIVERSFEHCLKIALTVQLAIDPCADEISEEAVDYSIALIDFLKRQEIKYYDLYYSENALHATMKRVTKMIADTGTDGALEPWLKSEMPLKGMKPRERGEILYALEEDKTIVKVYVKSKSGKGRPSWRYFTLDNAKNIPEERTIHEQPNP